MTNNYLTEIESNDLLEKELKLFFRGQDDFCYYIQIYDKDEILRDKNYTCHYEIMQIRNSNDLYHSNGKIYVEIHFESETNSPKFIPLIESLVKHDKRLMSYEWSSFCPAIRLKDSEFVVGEKEKILSNLAELKNRTLQCLLEKFKEIKQSNGFIVGFEFGKGKKSATKKHLPEIIREETEITVIHEQIKEKLIEELKRDKNLEIVSENAVNKINYIDIATKDKNGIITFYEIKTNSDARLCVRQALGQLMEYAFFPKVRNANKIVVVGTGSSTPEIDEYISELNEKFNIPVAYRQVKL
ncbi:hypothetical protein [Treponema sp. C6A8]|uniref:hypothetical protein n=1 Tax=Treponema sp. C6A8 TaxID=1410609 RepID=UPI0004868025|nr:hypothetical protein [Treponema sp. C6A8]